MEKKWDILIILDACRYDLFNDTYKEFFENKKLKKMISPATQTVEWLSKTFAQKKLDLIYVSSNPFVNSKNIKAQQGGFSFNGKSHFRKVVDVWDKKWNNDMGTVHPSDVNKASIVSIDLHRKIPHIIHYMQPHSPYIFYGGLQSHTHPIQTLQKNLSPANEFSVFSKIAKRLLSQEMIWNICKNLGRNPTWDLGKLYVKYGKDGIIRGYTEDLKLVLKYVKQLINLYPKKRIIVTADHGERLGEKGNYGHGGKREKALIEVPWLEFNI